MCVHYRITGNFCGVKFLRFWSKKMTFNFCGFLFLRIENIGTKKKNCSGSNNWSDVAINNWCTLQWSLEVKTFSSLESFQTLQLLNMHLVNFKFVLRNNFFTVFAIYFVDRKYEVNSWIDIGINFDIFRMYIFNVKFSYFII